MSPDGDNRHALANWVHRYEAAWRTPGTAALAALFAPDATYRTAPYEPPYRGIEAIAQLWEAEREGADETFTLESEIVAVEGRTGVVRVEVRYGDPVDREYRDLWVVRLTTKGAATIRGVAVLAPGRRLVRIRATPMSRCHRATTRGDGATRAAAATAGVTARPSGVAARRPGGRATSRGDGRPRRLMCLRWAGTPGPRSPAPPRRPRARRSRPGARWA